MVVIGGDSGLGLASPRVKSMTPAIIIKVFLIFAVSCYKNIDVILNFGILFRLQLWQSFFMGSHGIGVRNEIGDHLLFFVRK
jgi:hypothetical protein